MSEVTNNKLIYITRGDSLSIPFIINLGNEVEPKEYSLQEGDELYFGVMENNMPFECALIRKKYTYSDVDQYGVVNIILNPTDTICLIPGNYCYEVKLKRGDCVTTVMNSRRFVILD